MLVKSYPLFGSEIELAVRADEVVAMPILEDAYVFAKRLEKIFNIYDESSELSQLNKKRNMVVSDDLRTVLERALTYCTLCGTTYDISHGRKFLQRKSKKNVIDVKCSYHDISISKNTVTLSHPDVLVDLGSIAKGYIAQCISTFLQEHGIESGYVNARGDIIAFGSAQEIDVQHPRKDSVLCTIALQNKAVATSGDYRQFDGDYSKSHIINQTDIISATVIANDLTDADAFATVVMVCDPKKRDAIIKKSGLQVMTIDGNLNCTYYRSFQTLIKQ